MKDYDKNKESSYRKYWDVNKLYPWVMLQKLLANGSKWLEKWVENKSQFIEGFMKSYNEDILKAIKMNIFWELMFNIRINCMNFIITENIFT